MHDAGIVIRSIMVVYNYIAISLEVEESWKESIFSMDFHKGISVWSCVLMVEPYHVTQLMQDDWFLQEE